MAEADNTDTFILDLTKNSLPTVKDSKQTFGPGVLDKANLFCSGHCWLSDGRLIVFGGHIKDGWGSNQACIFNPKGGDKKQVFRHRNLDLSTFPFPSLDLSMSRASPLQPELPLHVTEHGVVRHEKTDQSRLHPGQGALFPAPTYSCQLIALA